MVAVASTAASVYSMDRRISSRIRRALPTSPSRTTAPSLPRTAPARRVPRAQGGSGDPIVGRQSSLQPLACSITPATPARLRVWTCPGMALWHSETRARLLQLGLQHWLQLLQHLMACCGIDGCQRIFDGPHRSHRASGGPFPPRHPVLLPPHCRALPPRPLCLEPRVAAGIPRGSPRSTASLASVSRRPHRRGCGSGPVLGWPCGIPRREPGSCSQGCSSCSCSSI